jgi:dynein heavy chain, axonemal
LSRSEDNFLLEDNFFLIGIFFFKVVENYLIDYNVTSKVPMDLVIFGFVISHVSRISRMLKQPNGNGLLIGIGGTGRTSATKLATFIADFELFQIEVSTKYATSEWRSDLKKLLKRAGVDGVNLVFFFNDHQIKDESFLEDINMLLNSSDIPSLFENDERNEIIDKVKFILFYSFSTQIMILIKFPPLQFLDADTS